MDFCHSLPIYIYPSLRLPEYSVAVVTGTFRQNFGQCQCSCSVKQDRLNAPFEAPPFPLSTVVGFPHSPNTIRDCECLGSPPWVLLRFSRIFALCFTLIDVKIDAVYFFVDSCNLCVCLYFPTGGEYHPQSQVL